jgi:hypothetical protein
MKITFTIEVNGLKVIEDVNAFCTDLAEQIVKCPVNDKCIIQKVIYRTWKGES